jgi:hypothetical protein
VLISYRSFLPTRKQAKDTLGALADFLGPTQSAERQRWCHQPVVGSSEREDDMIDDEIELTGHIVERVLDSPLAPLSEASGLSSGPGLYVIVYDGQLPMYAPIRRRWPIYIGSAASLRLRIVEHRRNLTGVADIAISDLVAGAVPVQSHALAQYAEALCISTFDPIWNDPRVAGFGSRYQGDSRAGQRQCPWSVLHPGRRSSRGAPVRSREELIEVVRAQLAKTAPRAGITAFT